MALFRLSVFGRGCVICGQSIIDDFDDVGFDFLANLIDGNGSDKKVLETVRGFSPKINCVNLLNRSLVEWSIVQVSNSSQLS